MLAAVDGITPVSDAIEDAFGESEAVTRREITKSAVSWLPLLRVAQVSIQELIGGLHSLARVV